MLASLISNLKNVVAVTRISGKITESTANDFSRQLKKIKLRAPKMIAVQINSHSGTFGQVQSIVSLLDRTSRELDCPIYTFAEDFAVGPAYYVLCAGNKVFADPHSMVGGIAVSTSTLGLQDLASQTSIKPKILSSGKHKVRLDPFSKLNKQDEEWVKGVLHKRLEVFKNQVLDKRGNKIPRSPELEQRVFSGESFSGKQAMELGLVDRFGEVHSLIQKEYSGFKTLDVSSSERSSAFDMQALSEALSLEQALETIEHAGAVNFANRLEFQELYY